VIDHFNLENLFAGSLILQNRPVRVTETGTCYTLKILSLHVKNRMSICQVPLFVDSIAELPLIRKNSQVFVFS
jgi:hypothetical protein